MRAHVVIPSYDCPAEVERCIESVLDQDQPGMGVHVIDDASPDPEHWRGVMRVWARRSFRVRRNRVNVGALRNIYDAVHHESIDDDDVVILVDGDDFLPHPGCVSRIMELYQDDDCWMAWGSYRSHPHDPECPAPGAFPPEVIEERSFRQAPTLVNHPISFRAWLFRAIPVEQFLHDDGTWMRHLYDEAISYPMLELAVDRWRFCEDVLYVYNSANPLSVNVARLDEARREGATLRGRPSLDPLPR